MPLQVAHRDTSTGWCTVAAVHKPLPWLRRWPLCLVCGQAGISVDTAFGDPRLGSAGEYSDALRKGTSVNLLLTEVTGARHAHAERFLRLCASAHAARFPHLVDSPATLSFYALHSTLLSVACLRGLGEQLRSRIVSSVSRASLRRRAPAGLCAPAPF